MSVTTVFAPKGGQGCTVIAASLAAFNARAGRDTLLVDLCGDVPGVLGIPEPTGPGVADWLASDTGVDALARCETRVAPNLSILHAGARQFVDLERLDSAFAEDRVVVIDAGTRPPRLFGFGVLVVRNDYLALRRAMQVQRPDVAVLVEEPDRALGATDVADVLGVPVVARIPIDPAVSRAVDAGLLLHRPPRGLAALNIEELV